MPTADTLSQRHEIVLHTMHRPFANLRAHWARLSIGFKWSAAFILLIFGCMSLFGWVAVQQQQDSFSAQIDRLGLAMASQLAAMAGEPLLAEDHLTLSVMLQRLSDQGGVLGAGVQGIGMPAITSGIGPAPSRPVSTTGSTAWYWQDAAHGTHLARDYGTPIYFGTTRVGDAVVTLDADSLDRGLEPILWKMILAASLLILCAVLLAGLLTRRLVRPLRALATIGGNLEVEVPTPLNTSGGPAEIERIVQVFNRLAVRHEEKQHLENLLHCFVPRHLARSHMQNPAHPVPNALPAVGSVVFSDVCGFTALSEPLPPEQIAELLNDYFLYITSAAHACGGVVDSFIGDCVMVVFAGSETDPLHALHATTCALLIRDTVQRLNTRRVTAGQLRLNFRTGVNTGPVALCNLGGLERMQPTVIGDTVNVAARLCGQGAPGEIIIGECSAAASQVSERFCLTRLDPCQIRGRRQWITPFRVDALAAQHQKQLRDMLERILPLDEPL